MSNPVFASVPALNTFNPDPSGPSPHTFLVREAQYLKMNPDFEIWLIIALHTNRSSKVGLSFLCTLMICPLVPMVSNVQYNEPMWPLVQFHFTTDRWEREKRGVSPLVEGSPFNNSTDKKDFELFRQWTHFLYNGTIQWQALHAIGSIDSLLLNVIELSPTSGRHPLRIA